MVCSSIEEAENEHCKHDCGEMRGIPEPEKMIARLEKRAFGRIDSSPTTEGEMMKKWIVLALLAVAGCGFDSREFKSAQHCLPSSPNQDSAGIDCQDDFCLIELSHQQTT